MCIVAALTNAYIPWNAATIHTPHVVSFFTVQKTIRCNLTSSAPDDGCRRPKHVELKKPQ